MHLSNFTITLGRSNDYLRLAALLHGFGIVVLLSSSLPLLLRFGMLCILLLSMNQIARSRIPLPKFSKLSFHTSYWLLHGLDEIRYEQAHISFDAGLFFLLTLINDGAKKKLVIFNDQLTRDQYRKLNIIGKITPKIKKEL